MIKCNEVFYTLNAVKQEVLNNTYAAVLPQYLTWIKLWGHNPIIHIVDINQDNSPGLHGFDGLKGEGKEAWVQV